MEVAEQQVIKFGKPAKDPVAQSQERVKLRGMIGANSAGVDRFCRNIQKREHSDWKD